MRTSTGLLRATSLVLLLGLATSACGSSPDDTPEAQVRSVIHKALTSRDPATCSTFFTRSFVEQTQLSSGPGAVGDCREALREGRPADDTAISRLSVSDRRARAQVAIRGGDEDGAHYDLRLVQRDGDWRLDRIADVELEFERYLRAGRKQLVRPPAALAEPEAGCVVGRIRRIGEARLERSIVAADATVLGDTLLPCLGPRSLRRQFEEGIRSGVGTDADSRCVIARLRASVSQRDIRAFVRASIEGGEPSRSLQRAIARALIACPSGSGTGEAQSS